jgi:hypothetical protein
VENLESNLKSPIPLPADWSPVAIRLLQGVIYHDDHAELWEKLLENVSPLTEYFGKLGLLLIVDEPDAMAFLRQIEDEEFQSDSPALPRLFRRTPLGYDATLLCVLLRDEFMQYEQEDVRNERCVVAQSDLLSMWQAFFPDQSDVIRLNRSLTSALRKLEELKFVRPFEKEPPTWEIRRIIKARLPLAELERLRASMADAVSALSLETDVEES